MVPQWYKYSSGCHIEKHPRTLSPNPASPLGQVGILRLCNPNSNTNDRKGTNVYKFTEFRNTGISPMLFGCMHRHTFDSLERWDRWVTEGRSWNAVSTGHVGLLSEQTVISLSAISASRRSRSPWLSRFLCSSFQLKINWTMKTREKPMWPSRVDSARWCWLKEHEKKTYICLHVLAPVIFAELFTAKAHAASVHQITMAYHGGTAFSKLRCHHPVQVLLARCEEKLRKKYTKLKNRRKDLGGQLDLRVPSLQSWFIQGKSKQKTNHQLKFICHFTIYIYI